MVGQSPKKHIGVDVTWVVPRGTVNGVPGEGYEVLAQAPPASSRTGWNQIHSSSGIDFRRTGLHREVRIVTLRLKTRRRSEPILAFACPFEMVCVPTPVFAATVSEFDAKVNALPEAAPVNRRRRGIPCTFAEAAATSEPCAVEVRVRHRLMSPSGKNRVVFIQRMM